MYIFAMFARRTAHELRSIHFNSTCKYAPKCGKGVKRHVYAVAGSLPGACPGGGGTAVIDTDKIARQRLFALFPH